MRPRTPLSAEPSGCVPGLATRLRPKVGTSSIAFAKLDNDRRNCSAPCQPDRPRWRRRRRSQPRLLPGTCSHAPCCGATAERRLQLSTARAPPVSQITCAGQRASDAAAGARPWLAGSSSPSKRSSAEVPRRGSPRRSPGVRVHRRLAQRGLSSRLGTGTDRATTQIGRLNDDASSGRLLGLRRSGAPFDALASDPQTPRGVG
jgi:hypothetical protein